MTGMTEHLELPRPLSLARTMAWNLFEAVGFPIAAFYVAYELDGRNAGLIAALAAVWLAAAIRKVVTKSVPGLLIISAVVLTLQTAAAIATGNLWIFLLHFPFANLCLCVLFARTASGPNPLCARLAAEMMCLRQPAACQASLHRFFQGATWLWAGVFLAIAVCLGVLLAIEPIPVFLVLTTVATVVLICIGIGASILWLRSVLRKLGISLRFAAA